MGAAPPRGDRRGKIAFLRRQQLSLRGAQHQAARDLGLFLSKQGAAAGAQKVFAEVVRLDETALGANAEEIGPLGEFDNPDDMLRQAHGVWCESAR